MLLLQSGFASPHLQYSDLWPILVVFGVACVGLLVEAFVPRERRYLTQIALAAGGLVAALVGAITIATTASYGPIAEGAIEIDGPGLFLWGVVLVVALLGVSLFAERVLTGGVTAFAGQAAALPGTEAERTASLRGVEHTEVYPLLMFAVGGMMLFPVASDLLMLFVALEVLSLPLYVLTGLARRRRLLSQEAALKYFLLGAFSSAFFLYGLALVYGYAGSMSFSDIASASDNGASNHALLLIGIAFMLVGLLFKVGAVPFQSWIPDVYQGAPTPVTAWMSAATKVAAFGALLRLLYVAFENDADLWRPVIAVIAIFTMMFGAVVAVAQTDVKRMLGYSAISHTGFLLAGVTGFFIYTTTGPPSSNSVIKPDMSAIGAVIFYLLAYSCASIGAFAVVSIVRDASGEATGFDAWRGLGRRSPLTAGVFAIFLFSMAGIPLTAGFIGKWAVFASASRAGQWPVLVFAIAASIIAVFFYVRFVMLMFFEDSTSAAENAHVATVTRPSLLTSGVIGLAVFLTVAAGVAPGPILDLIRDAGLFIL